MKQNIFFLNNAESAAQIGHAAGGLPHDGMGHQLNVNLLLTILSAVRQHAVSDKMRLAVLSNTMVSPNTTSEKEQVNDHVSKQISKVLSSFRSCVHIMIDVGERILFRLPNSSHSRQLGGMVVRGLVESYIDHNDISSISDTPLSYLARESDSDSILRSLIDPLRYADAVANAMSNPFVAPNCSSDSNMSHEPSEKLIEVQPPEDVQDIVKALFMRDLVDLHISGCGYGDFLSWCHLPISPEPLLFDYISNFPSYLNGEDDGGPQNNYWTIDEVSELVRNY